MRYSSFPEQVRPFAGEAPQLRDDFIEVTVHRVRGGFRIACSYRFDDALVLRERMRVTLGLAIRRRARSSALRDAATISFTRGRPVASSRIS